VTNLEIRIVQAEDAARWNAARTLVQVYVASLGVDLSFQDFDREFHQLAVEYGPPSGAFLLADRDGEPLGCVGVRRFSDDTAEMKRLYVTPAGRRQGIGRRLAEAAIGAARTMSYARLVLDTLPSLAEARALYRSLGFVETSAYRFNPIRGTTFFELRLR